MPMQNYTAERLIRLFDQRWSALGDWRNRWEEESFYVMPQQRSFTSRHNPGNRRQEQLIFDSTALEANERLATRMHEALTNPATNWFRLAYQDDDLNENDAAMEWLQSSERRMVDAIAASNFNMIMGQFYLDLGCFGTAMLCCDEAKPLYPNESDGTFHGLSFSNLHMSGVAVAENPDGIIDDVFSRFDMTAEQCWRRWGENAPKLALDKIKAGKPDDQLKILVCKFPRALESRPAQSALLPKERPYAEVWVDYTGKQMIDDNGTYEQAAYVGRWRKKSDDIMGYGPGERAMATIRTVNEAERLELQAWAKMIDPPIKTTQNNVLGDLEIRAKGLTTVRRMEETEQWDIRPDLNHHMIQLEDKRFQIRDIFKYHSLELPPREQVGEMTAYEVAKRVEQVYRALGPVVTQLQADVLNPLIQRVFGIMYRKDQFDPLPEGLEGVDMKVEYTGPMALSARATEIEAIDRYVADAMALATAGVPEAMDAVDLDAAQKYKARLMGVPAIVMRSDEQIERIRADRAEAQEQAAANQQALDQADALGKLGAAPPELIAGMTGTAAAQ